MKEKSSFLSVAVFASSIAFVGDSSSAGANDAAITGVWHVDGSSISETITFTSDGGFVYSYSVSKKDGKDNFAARTHSAGAYKQVAEVCSVGAAKGNLWVVKDSQRCCFNVHMMGKKLVLDEVQGGTPTYPASLCANKTLTRHVEQPSK